MKVRIEWPWYAWDIEVEAAPNGPGFVAWADVMGEIAVVAATEDDAIRKAYAAALRRLADGVETGEMSAGLNGEM